MPNEEIISEPKPEEYIHNKEIDENNESIKDNQAIQENVEPKENDIKEDDVELEGGEGDQEDEQNIENEENNSNFHNEDEQNIEPSTNEHNEEQNPEVNEENLNEEINQLSPEQEEFKYDAIGDAHNNYKDVIENWEEQPFNNVEQEEMQENKENTEQIEEVVNDNQDEILSREDSIDIDLEEQLNIEIESLQYEAIENKEKIKSLKFMMEKLQLVSKVSSDK